jgi:small subunit ribosomal protein S13
MFRIAGVSFRRKSLVIISLTKIFGIGKSRAKQIVEDAGILVEKRCVDLTTREISLLRFLVEKRYRYQIEGNLRRRNSQNIARLSAMRSYRGYRHRACLPVRGQRTRTNARTRKWRRRKSNEEIAYF